MVEAIGTWFAGVVTAGSFWLGFTILRSDRKKEERAQASRFVVWSLSSTAMRNSRIWKLAFGTHPTSPFSFPY